MPHSGESQGIRLSATGLFRAEELPPGWSRLPPVAGWLLVEGGAVSFWDTDLAFFCRHCLPFEMSRCPVEILLRVLSVHVHPSPPPPPVTPRSRLLEHVAGEPEAQRGGAAGRQGGMFLQVSVAGAGRAPLPAPCSLCQLPLEDFCIFLGCLSTPLPTKAHKMIDLTGGNFPLPQIVGCLPVCCENKMFDLRSLNHGSPNG